MRRNPNGTGHKWLLQHLDFSGDGCLIWPFSCCTPGYGQFAIGYKHHLAHRWMCEATKGPPPSPDYETAHSCGNRRCVNPKHLFWKTVSENQIERRIHGTNKKTRWKLTPDQVAQIRQLKGVETSIETAARYGVTESNVRLIQDGKIWKTGRYEKGGFAKKPWTRAARLAAAARS